MNSPGASQTLLVVDDNPAALYATCRVLRAGGFEVIEATSGGEALEKAKDRGIDLIVLDVNLPDIDGFEVCRQLRARSLTAYLPIMHLSAAHMSPSDTMQGFESGADSYLTHPVDPSTLLATVRALLFARKADAHRRAADARFRAVFDMTAVGIGLMDGGRLVDVNDAFCALFRRPREELLGLNGDVLIAPGHEEAISQSRATVLRDGYWQGLLPIRRSDGDTVEVEWRVVHEPTNNTRIVMATDVTERERLLDSERAARAEAERSSRSREEFLAMLSHELRNPLNAIVGWTALLRRTPDLPPSLEQGLEAIERSSRVQNHLIADILDFSSISVGKMRLSLEALDPGVPITAALDIIAGQASGKGVQLERRVSSVPASVMGDEARLQQIVWNLLTNAVKFTPRGGSISLEAGVRGQEYRIVVRDNGSGISPAFLPRLFDKFSQQRSARREGVGGLGIGLSIVKSLVDMHHGRIEVHSDGEGQGATFTVSLPLAAAATPPKSAAILLGIKVLVVEDDRDARTMVARLLTEAGARVAAAADAEEGMIALEATQPDVLVSDIGLPRQDGYQMLRAMRASGWDEQRLPAVALTAFSRSEDRADALAAGFQVHLSKPVNVEALLSAIARLGARRLGS